MTTSKRPIRMGMVGGGPGSFIGPVHRMAAMLDGDIHLVAGAFSQDAARSRQAGQLYGIAADRCYPDFAQMFAAERQRPDPMDFVAIATPNHTHAPIALAALQQGFAVFSDKPATTRLAEAHAIAATLAETRGLYALTFTYSGYPLVRAAQAICRQGRLGVIRKVIVEYSQGWLAQPIEQQGQKQAQWRADPAQGGLGGCIADIGVHAFHLLEYVTGCQVVSLCADLSRQVADRRLDDDCNVLLHLDNGGAGVLATSQIACGARNGLVLQVYGEKGGLRWAQEDPNRLELVWPDQPGQTIHAATPPLADGPAAGMARLPSGHPEGYIEAFANLYRDFATSLRQHWATPGCGPTPALPGIEAGLRSMAFLELAVAHNRQGWIPFTLEPSAP